MAFCTLVMSQLVRLPLPCRGRVSSGTGEFAEHVLFAAVGLSVGLQIFGVHHDLGRAFLGTRTLSLLDWALVLFLSGWSTFLASAARAAKRALSADSPPSGRKRAKPGETEGILRFLAGISRREWNSRFLSILFVLGLWIEYLMQLVFVCAQAACSAERMELQYMLTSMTGYGRAASSSPDGAVTVEVRSLNQYFDVSLRMPRSFPG